MMKTLFFLLLQYTAHAQDKFLDNFIIYKQTSDNKETKDEVLDEFNACNYQTGNNTLYHLNDINNADGGSGGQQLVVQNDTTNHHVAVFNYCRQPLKESVYKCPKQSEDANAVYIPDFNSKTPQCVSFDQGELKDLDKFDQYGNRVGFQIEYTQSDAASQESGGCPNGARSEPYKL